jgi:hypothetical protein
MMNEAYRCGYEDPASGLVLHRERVKLGHAAELRALADIIEQRGAQDIDRDPGETADWLRAEADRAEVQA